ncbi:MAG: DUF2066 domain-containing protein [Geminicoccaceae bacterium]
MRNAALLLVAAMIVILAAAPTRAGEIASDLYEASTIVTGEREETRLPGLRTCYETVLVKISGDPGVIEAPGEAALADQAASSVVGFRYHDRLEGMPHHDEQGSRDRPYDLIVRFDPARIDAALRWLGRAPWTGPRPRLVPIVAMRRPLAAYLVAADGPRDLEREALLAAADQHGMPATLPSEAALAAAGLGVDTLADAGVTQLEAVARAASGEAALVGTMRWDEAAIAWATMWRLVVDGRAYAWHASGPTFDGAFRAAIGDAARILSGHGASDPAPSDGQ